MKHCAPNSPHLTMSKMVLPAELSHSGRQSQCHIGAREIFKRYCTNVCYPKHQEVAGSNPRAHAQVASQSPVCGVESKETAKRWFSSLKFLSLSPSHYLSLKSIKNIFLKMLGSYSYQLQGHLSTGETRKSMLFSSEPHKGKVIREK